MNKLFRVQNWILSNNKLMGMTGFNNSSMAYSGKNVNYFFSKFSPITRCINRFSLYDVFTRKYVTVELSSK